MEWTELCVRVPSAQTEAAANIATMTVPYGFYIEDYSDLEAGAWEVAHIDLIDEDLLKRDRTTSVIHLYLATDENAAEAIAFLTEHLRAAGIEFSFDTSRVRDSDWADNWKQYFKCTEIGQRLVIRPSWETYEGDANRKVLSIDPGAAFGTGTHATTSLCLELLEQYVKPGDTTLDIGAGSGILSIAAALLGGGQAVGVDIDPQAVKTARENAALNGLSERVRYLEGNLADEVEGTYDIVCANIVADAIIALSRDVPRYLKPGGYFICSGIIDSRAPEVEAALVECGLKIAEHCSRECWHAYITTRRELCSNLKNKN